ncbi:ATP-binding protein [Verminephrobacter aporrectodeae subsp. tuberculatae]|uniref:AAA family ATPase n=1 Tax=Verminephrobacter aporrectodeae TaxID=1110389 RepID=UPI00224306FA|nr:ATP-binding protein [Verminephrobacter aporrectodeae]MCW8165247.1 ATP-binding protein [Verminephrobacter aporrectodeae subsp. tuberculatae]MCW8167819.1 ATP-binding protein [Verminephrobacter aporrectodeae subsp. tuberculatae]
MLIEFRVTNFRSLRDEQVLSLVASSDKTLQDSHTQATGIRAAPFLVRSAVVYGANASGKSNLIRALKSMRGVVTQSATAKPDQIFAAQPFRLDADSIDQPIEFEATLLLDGVRYQYGFALTTQRVVSEHLLVYQAFKPQRWFKRHFDTDTGKDVYEFGSGLKGPKNLWEGATRPNALFLSVAVQLNSDALRPVFDWFENRLLIVNEQTRFTQKPLIQMLQQADGRKEICNFLSAADISIADITVETRKIPRISRFDSEGSKTEMQSEEMEEHTPRTYHKLLFHHVTERGKAVFDLMDESSGTHKLLLFAEPVLDTLRNGQTLVVDELDTSLHSLLLRELVRLFHHSETNTGGAQLIFTTHDTSLLDAPDLFRRDQVWLVEKDRDQASALVSLSEFSPRKNEALERGYLTGRYGGVPLLSHALGLKH